MEENGITNYYYHVAEMAYEDLDIPAVERTSEPFKTFVDLILVLQDEYSGFWFLYPLFVNPKYKSDLLELIKKFVKENGDSCLDYDNWANVLNIDIKVFQDELK